MLAVLKGHKMDGQHEWTIRFQDKCHLVQAVRRTSVHLSKVKKYLETVLMCFNDF